MRVERGVFSQIPSVASSPVASGKIQIFHRRAPHRGMCATETGLGARLPRTIIPALFSSLSCCILSRSSHSISPARFAPLTSFICTSARFALLLALIGSRRPASPSWRVVSEIAIRLRSLISLALRFPFPTVMHGDSFVRHLPPRRPAASQYSMAPLRQPRLASRLSRARHPLFVRGPSGRRSPSGPRSNRMAVIQVRMLGRCAGDFARHD